MEDEGFTQLVKPRYTLPSSLKAFHKNVTMKIYENLKLEVSQAVSGIEYFGITTDVWSTYMSNESSLSLTAHWITATF